MSGRPLAEQPVCVLGAGSWGTALARHLALAGRSVRLWFHERDLAEEAARTRVNETFLPGFDLPESLEIGSDLAALLEDAGGILLVVPSRHCRAVLKAAAPHIPAGRPVVVAAKGIEQGSLLSVSGLVELILDRPGGRGVAVLSGPSFAREVAAGKPTAVVAAARDEALAREVQELMVTPEFRVYTSPDPVGVELGGALKNVIAIAAGVVEGAGMGSNTVAALITRGLAEISRMAEALGGSRESLAGLAGLGDLVLTCTGSLSRNRQVGLAVGSGKRLEEVLSGMKMVAEGVDTSRSALELGRREGISMPITEKVNQVLFQSLSPGEAIRDLMDRPQRPEAD